MSTLRVLLCSLAECLGVQSFYDEFTAIFILAQLRNRIKCQWMFLSHN